jgi:hypothetical protein
LSSPHDDHDTVIHRSDVGGRKRVVILCVLLVAAGCGYQPYGTGAGRVGPPPEIQSLHLAPLTNATFNPGIDGAVSAAILRRLQQDGRIRLVSQEAAATVLGGTITTYENLPITFDEFDIGKRFRVRIRLALTLTQRGGEKALLKEEIFGEAYYTAGVEVLGTRTAEEEATQRAAQDLAARVVARLLEGL